MNAKMLTARDSNLCLKCHFQQVQGGQLRIGGADHTIHVQQGTCWTAGCHESRPRIPRQLVAPLLTNHFQADEKRKRGSNNNG